MKAQETSTLAAEASEDELHFKAKKPKHAFRSKARGVGNLKKATRGICELLLFLLPSSRSVCVWDTAAPSCCPQLLLKVDPKAPLQRRLLQEIHETLPGFRFILRCYGSCAAWTRVRRKAIVEFCGMPCLAIITCS